MAVVSTEMKAKTLEEFDMELGGEKPAVPKEPKAPKLPKPKKKKIKKQKEPKQVADGSDSEDDVYSPPKKTKKPKPPKTPKVKAKKPVKKKVAKPKSAKPRTTDNTSAKHPVRNTFLAVNVFWLILLASFILLMRMGKYDDAGDYRFLIDPEGIVRGPVWLFLNPEEPSREEYFYSEFDEFREWEIELESQQEELDMREAELDTREENLDDRESEVEEKQEQVDELLGELKNISQGTGISNDISVVVKMIAEMTPAAAAAMLTDLDTDSLVYLFSNLKPKVAGPILDAMDVDIGTAILAEMVLPPEDDFE